MFWLSAPRSILRSGFVHKIGAAQTSSGSCPASGTQTRTFQYDQLGRLTGATNPESGATAYTYDHDGNEKTKTDAGGTTVTFSYDALNRLTGKSYSDSTPAVTYCYDASAQTGACAGAPSGTGLNLNGRLTLVTSPVSSTAYGQYSSLGDALSTTQTTGGTAYPFAYTYKLASAMTGMTFPSGRKASWASDGGNRVNAVTGLSAQGSAATYASSVAYASNDGVSAISLGNSLYETRTYDGWRQ